MSVDVHPVRWRPPTSTLVRRLGCQLGCHVRKRPLGGPRRWPLPAASLGLSVQLGEGFSAELRLTGSLILDQGRIESSERNSFTTSAAEHHFAAKIVRSSAIIYRLDVRRIEGTWTGSLKGRARFSLVSSLGLLAIELFLDSSARRR